MPDVQFHTIGMHPRFHLDEAAACLLLKKRGENMFPGVAEAEIVFDGTGGTTFQGLNGDDLLQEGIILLGIGGGMFDEHAGPGHQAKEGECTTTLVAHKLGITNEPGLQRILKFVYDTDTKAIAQPFDIASTLKDVHGICSPAEAMTWAFTALMAKWNAQEKFCKADQALKTANIKSIVRQGGRVIKMITADTDDEKFKDAARAKGMAIMIKRNSRGQVQIFTDHKHKIILDVVCENLRREEQKIRGVQENQSSELLRSVGKVADIPEWYMHESQMMLLNGSNAHPDVKPTQIPLERIEEIVRLGVK